MPDAQHILNQAAHIHNKEIPALEAEIEKQKKLRDSLVVQAWKVGGGSVTYETIAEALDISKSYVQIMMESGRGKEHAPSRAARRTGRPKGRPRADQRA